jgi:ArsR family transcriptional regulator
MPAQVDGRSSNDVRVALAPIMELESTMCGIVDDTQHRWGGLGEVLLEGHPALVERLRTFWGDGHTEWVEFFILTERAGLTLASDPEPVIAALPEIAAPGFTVPDLPSEDASVRAITQARIDRLAASPGLRAEYAGLLADLWRVGRREWLEHGRGAAEEMRRSLQSRLDAGEALLSVLPPRHLAHNDAFRPLLEGSPVVVTPLGLGGSVKYILQASPGPVYVGFGPGLEKTEIRRQRQEEAAAAFKLLSDPTRLGILQYLLSVPASVSDLASCFDVSQPTISAHVKMLREAGLLVSSRKGSHTLYRADADALRASVDRAEGLLFTPK